MENVQLKHKLTSHSHHDWEKTVIGEHAMKKPFAPENGTELVFKIGTPVIFTNDYGVCFKLKVTGFYKPNPIDSMYATGSRYLLDSDSPWFPFKESSLRLDRGDGDSQIKTAQELAARYGHTNDDSSTVLRSVIYEDDCLNSDTKELRVCGAGPGAYFEWKNEYGDRMGAIFDSLEISGDELEQKVVSTFALA